MIRLAAVSAPVLGFFYMEKQSEKRGLYTSIYHLVIFCLGWIIAGWVGILVFSLPLVGVFYSAMFPVAMGTIPASNPDDTQERFQRYMIFLSYVWGVQMPMWNVGTVKPIKAEKKIDGKPITNPFNGLKFPPALQNLIHKKKIRIFDQKSLFPGLVRTDTHQVVGIMNGNNFRVEGPGVIFTDKGDEPFEVVDLRIQNKRNTIHAFSKEGIPFKADVSVTFTIDREDWEWPLYHKLKTNRGLLNAKDIIRTPGFTFPYSKPRVEAAIRLRSNSPKPNGETELWDDYVLAQAEQAARETLSERSIKDLWQAREDENSSASEAITANIKKLIEGHLRANGIRVLSAKAAEFNFSNKDGDEPKEDVKSMDGNKSKENDKSKEDDVIMQQIQTWTVERDRVLKKAQADAKTEAERIEQEARVYAQSILLAAIMEGLEQAKEHHQDKDPDKIALIYLDALKKMIEEQSADTYYRSEAMEKVEKIREQYFPGSSKE